MKRTSSDGTIGEQLARQWFKRNEWTMFRHQPPTRVVTVKGKPIVIPCESDGVFDFTGLEKEFVSIWVNSSALLPVYRACEVKEAHGDSMPASRLDKRQRDWGAALPVGSAYVAICWMDGSPSPWVEVFPFMYRGSYQQGGGWK